MLLRGAFLQTTVLEDEKRDRQPHIAGMSDVYVEQASTIVEETSGVSPWKEARTS